MKDCTWLAECKSVIDERKPTSRSATNAVHLSNAADYYISDQESVVLVNSNSATGLRQFDVLASVECTMYT